MTKIIYWLGNTPKDIKDLSKEDIITYFAYIYEYYWNKEQIEAHVSVEAYLNKLLKELEEDNLSNEKTWWGFVLLILKDLAELRKYTYLITVIEKVFNNIQALSLEELESYCNNINCVVIGEGLKTLVVRPFEMNKLCGEEALIANNFKQCIELKDEVVTTLERYITDSNLNMDYIGTMFLSNKEKTSKYAPIMVQYTEFLFSYFKTAYQSVKTDPKMGKMNSKQRVKLVIGSFFEVSLKPIKPVKKLNDLKNEITEILTRIA